MTAWSIEIGPSISYFVVKTGAGWVESYDPGGSGPFATADVSVGGTSFHDHAVYNGGNTGYVADLSGTLSDACSIGETTPLGRWHSNHDPVGGTFTATALCSPVNGTRALSSASSGAGLPACRRPKPRLTVSLRVSGTGLAGLSYDKTADHPGFLTTPSDPDVPGSCLSGCENVRAIVTDGNGKGVEGAKVSINVSPFPANGIAPYPGNGPGGGHLCAEKTYTNCGTSLSLTTTDTSGAVAALYWEPGVITTHTVKITVTATYRHKTARTGKSFTVAPHVVWCSSFVTTSDEESALEDWAKPTGLAEIAAGRAPSLQSLLQSIAKSVGQGGAATALGWATTLNKFATQEEQEEELTGVFMSRFGVTSRGLLDGFLSEFAHDWAGKGTVPDGFTLGLLTKYAQTVLLKQRQTSAHQLLKLDVEEISFCETNSNCGPGLRDHATGLYSGVRPFLRFFFAAGDRPGTEPPGTFPLSTGAFVIPYDADAWLSTQGPPKPPCS